MKRIFASLVVCFAPLAAACSSPGAPLEGDVERTPSPLVLTNGDPGVSGFAACCSHCDTGGSCSGCSSTEGRCGKKLTSASCDLVDGEVTNCQKPSASLVPDGGSYAVPNAPFQGCCEHCTDFDCYGCNDVPDGTTCKSPKPLKANCKVIDGVADCSPS